MLPSMSSGPSPLLFSLSVLIACAIVAVGWFACAALVWVYASRRLARLEAGQPPAEPPDSALLLYALSVLFWPAGFLLGAHLMRQARTARQGRVCIGIGLGYISAIVLLTCGGMAILGFMAPGLLR